MTPETLKELMMMPLQKLKFVSADRRASLSPREIRRIKLCRKLDEQLELARAQASGERYVPMKLKRVRDAVTGERTTQSVPKRVSPWWWKGAHGRLCLAIRYGSKVVEVVKGRNAIEATDHSELIEALESVRLAVADGELDLKIESSLEGAARKTLSLRKSNAT